MVAKAAQNLFDVSVGGAGFHFTSHLIALVALFIACFAIAGYITFRSDSIPASALKDGDGFADEDLTAKSLTLSGALNAKVLAHTTGNYSLVSGLSTTAIAATDTAITVPEADTIYASAWVCANALTVTLPRAVEGRLVQYHQNTGTAITGNANANALTFTRSGTDTFNTLNEVSCPGTNLRPVDGAPYVATVVNQTDTAAAGDVNFLYTPAATANNNFGGAGSVISLYCARSGVWDVNIPVAVVQGTGADGVISFS